jgi:hypothetical protein
MNTNHAKRYAIASGLIVAAATGAVLTATSSSGSAPKPNAPAVTSSWTPNDCIHLNGGDYNACNVGNSGRGDLPYHVVTAY